MLDSSENISSNYREKIAAKMAKTDQEIQEKKSQTWDYKILAFLKEKASRSNVDRVSMDKTGKTLTYYFGDKKVTLIMQLFNIRVGESGVSGCMTMSTQDYENNPWFQEAYAAYPIELKLL
jgi:hypothetical protein